MTEVELMSLESKVKFVKSIHHVANWLSDQELQQSDKS